MNNERRNKGGTASLPFILTKAWLLPSSFHDCEKFREVSELKDNMEGKRLTLTRLLVLRFWLWLTVCSKWYHLQCPHLQICISMYLVGWL